MAEKEYIEREEVREALYMEFDNAYADDITDRLPAADVQEVRHGKWETIIDPDGNIEGWLHKECGRQVMSKDNFCPNCGAKMGKE